MPRITKRRALVLGSLVALVFAALLGSQLSASSAAQHRRATTETVAIRGKPAANGHHATLFFQHPKTVHQGDSLRIVMKTDPKKVGPHTFSLVKQSKIPTTVKQEKKCFPAGICGVIAAWHGVTGPNTPPSKNPAKAGKPGWDKMGSSRRDKGDSWFTGNKPGASFTQVVSAKPGTTLTFMCAIHPFMHGKIKVVK
jgi:hypothetical protein